MSLAGAPLKEVSYRVEGTRGPWVTFVTGIANDYSMWDAQAPPLTGEFRVLRYDLRGQGGTPAGKGTVTIEWLVTDLVLLWDSLGIARSHVVGLGLGGAIAQATAIRLPMRVDRLVPCCCRAQMVPDFAVLWHQLIATVKAQGIEPIVEPTLERWFPEPFRAANPAVIDAVRGMIRRTSVAGYLGCAGAFLGLALEDRLHLIKARTLYLSGADDHRGGPSELMAGLAAKVPGARHAAIADAAHVANIQNPAGFNRALGDFLREK
jgi:3-oxoadipate enol-lactonase